MVQIARETLHEIRVSAWATKDVLLIVLLDLGLVAVWARVGGLKAVSTQSTNIGLGAVLGVVVVADSLEFVQATLLAECGLGVKQSFHGG